MSGIVRIVANLKDTDVEYLNIIRNVYRNYTYVGKLNPSVYHCRNTKGQDVAIKVTKDCSVTKTEGCTDCITYYSDSNLGLNFIEMEYFTWTFYNVYWEKYSNCSPELIGFVLSTILCTLDRLHASGFRHMNLTMSNVGVGKEQLKLMHFESLVNIDKVQLSHIMTTYSYCPPDYVLTQANGTGVYPTALVAATDVWSFGCLVLHTYGVIFPADHPDNTAKIMLEFFGYPTEEEAKKLNYTRVAAVKETKLLTDWKYPPSKLLLVMLSVERKTLEEKLKDIGIPIELIRVLEQIFVLDYTKRPTTTDLLKLPYFSQPF